MAKIKIVALRSLSSVDMTVHLINSEGERLSVGCIVHVTTGPTIGRAYRYEGVHVFGKTHRVKVTRKSPYGHFRSVEWVHPTMLGCRVECPRTLNQRCHDAVLTTWHRVDDWIMAGVFALIPLAMFEHFHMADNITEAITLGMITGGGGH
jgi:hypothetical protein